jgi:tetratricopeptide (TPR) repeat protein
MGTVYAVRRADGLYEQRAALKLLRRAADDPASRERFRRERQILARLEHPAIARLLDGGVAPDGRPFLVLERVDGQPITRWCDERSAGVEERVRLFVSVLEAVEHAHRNLVVHRDLKPSNIFVDDDGRAKLLDFGVAKLLEEELDGDLTRTRAPAPLTPQYAAPEQVTGQPVTTATDVYALGLVLYELLAGARPYRLASDSALELERQIVGGTTAPPSSAAARGGADAAAQRGSTPQRLARRLSGDLDAVVLRALAKEPERRYRSAGELRRDLEAHLAGRPVEARPDSAAYRARKFVRRHRLGVTAAAAVALALLAGLAALGYAVVESRARLVEARRAEAIKDFLVKTLAETDPAQGARPERTLAEVLEAGERRLTTELADQPATRAELALTLGTVERNLGHYERAEKLLGEARTLTESEYGAESPQTGRVLLAVGDLYYWRDEYPQAEATHRQALKIFAAAGPAYRDELANAHYNVGAALRQMGRFEEAIAEEQLSLAIDRQLHGPESLDAADGEEGLALLLHSAGRDREGLPLAEHALAVRRARLAADHPKIASALETAGLIDGELGEFEAAIRELREALAIRRRAYGEEHPQVVESLNGLASTLLDAGRTEEAIGVRREAYALATKVYAGVDSSLAAEANNLAVLCYRLRDWACAESGFRDALAAWRRVHGPQHPHVASAVNNLGMTLLARGRPGEALSDVEEGLAIRRQVFGEESSDVAQSLRNLGLVELALHRVAEARRALEECVELSRRVYPERHPRLAEALAARAELELAEHRGADAVRDLEEAVAIRTEKLGADNPLTEQARAALARARSARPDGGARGGG